jgi:methylmalonyl-CoA carboxyltransferase large subunit
VRPPTGDEADIRAVLQAIRQELSRLGERVAALEAVTGLKPRPASPPVVAQADGLSEELILVISAAVAAFLGKKPHIRQIRLLGSSAWAQQGRATIQASHTLPFKHGS